MKNEYKINKNKLISLMSLEFFFFYGSMGFIQPYLSLELYKIGMSGTQIGFISTISSLLTFLISPFISIVYDNSKKKRLFTQLLVLLSGMFYYFIGQILLFWIVLLFISISHICNSTIIPVTENLAYKFSAFIGGWILDVYNIKFNFLLNLIFMLIVTGLLYFMPVSTFYFANSGHNYQGKLRSKTVLMKLTSNRYLLIVIAALAIFNLSNGIGQFEAIYMSQLDISETLIGLAITITAIFEIPFMLWADDLVKKFGVTNTLAFVFIFEFLRRILVYFFPFAWVVFVTKLLHSVSFGLRTVLTIGLINQQVPNKYSTSVLTLVTVTIFGIFNMIGSGINGVVFDIFSARELYLLGGIICLIALCLIFYASIINKTVISNKKKYQDMTSLKKRLDKNCRNYRLAKK